MCTLGEPRELILANLPREFNFLGILIFLAVRNTIPLLDDSKYWTFVAVKPFFMNVHHQELKAVYKEYSHNYNIEAKYNSIFSRICFQ